MAEFTAEQMREHLDTGKGRDGIIVEMVANHEYSLNSATKRYAELAKELDISTGRSRKADALPLLSTSAEQSAAFIKEECDAVANQLGITSKTVQGYLKEVYEVNGWTWPEVGSESAGILEWLVEHDACTKEQFEGFMATASKDGGKRSQSNINEYWKGMTLHRAIVAKQAAMEDAE